MNLKVPRVGKKLNNWVELLQYHIVVSAGMVANRLVH